MMEWNCGIFFFFFFCSRRFLTGPISRHVYLIGGGEEIATAFARIAEESGVAPVETDCGDAGRAMRRRCEVVLGFDRFSDGEGPEIGEMIHRRPKSVIMSSVHGGKKM